MTFSPNMQARGAKPYGRLEYRNGRWVISGLAPHVAIRLKANFPQINKAQTGTFELSDLDNVCADLDWFLGRYPMEMEAKDRARLSDQRQFFERRRDELEQIMLPNWKPPTRFGFKPGFKLWQIQEQAVELTHRKKRILLADTVGNGKTFSALGAIVGSPYLPAAVVAKTHLPTQWVNDFIKPFTYLSAHIIEGTTPYTLPPANVYIWKYSNIAGWSDIAATGAFKAFIADEVHELRKGVSTQKGKACKVFADLAQICLPMSGTPVFNYGDEIFNIMDIFIPGILGTFEEFTREWCTWRGNGKWKVNDPEALGTYLREMQVFLRRVRQGRPVNTEIIEVDYDYEIDAKARDLARTLALKVRDGGFQESGQAARDLDHLARRVTGVAKARGVAAFVRMLLSQGVPLLLGGWHRDCYDIWLKELADFNPLMYTGTEPPKKKDQTKHALIRGESNLGIFSLRSGDGVDGLQKRFRTVVHGEMDWSPLVHEQFLGRIDREGQDADVLDSYWCVVNEGSDPVIREVHGLKRSQARGITDPLGGVGHVYHDSSRLKALADRYLEVT